MAIVKCDKCGLEYDDTYRWTFCPHDTFQMDTLAVKGGGSMKRVHSIEELNTFLYGGDDATES